MKKVFLMLMAVLTFGSAIVSCSDKETDPITPENPSTPETPVTPTPTETADYTVIFWGMSGGVETSASTDLATLAYNYQQGKIGKNVRFAGLMKTGVSTAYENVDPSYDKTWYFDSETIGATPAVPESHTKTCDVLPLENVKERYEEAFATMGGKVYGDTNYPLNEVDSLAGFIKKAAEKFPARHYVLMFFGHGNGFSPVDDTPVTKACVSDDFRDNVALSADEVVSAVQKSGVKIQTVFTQCCLMGSLENIAAYSQVFDYGILSAETTLGFYFPQYLANLSQAGDDETKMQEQSRNLIDYYVERCQQWAPKFVTSHGFYDLRKASTLLAATKEAADWYATNYANDDYKKTLEKALASSISCMDLTLMTNYEVILEQMQEVRLMMQKFRDEEITSLDGEEFVDAVSQACNLMVEVAPNTTSGFCLADLMKNTLNADLPEDKLAALKTIYDKYMAAVKDMAYIRTTNKPASADANYEYDYASPTINVFSMNPDYFIPIITGEMERKELYAELLEAINEDKGFQALAIAHQLLEGTYYANNGHTLDEVKGNYTSSVFDQQVGWSKFLEQLELSPSQVVCPDRWQVNQEYEE